MPPILELQQVCKTFGRGIVAARGVNLAVEPGELFVLLGPSGSGKSTLLRLIAGLETADAGSILIEGRPVDRLAPRDRGVALVFQDPVLYPHLDVRGNLAFGLRARRVTREETTARVAEVAGLLGLGDLLPRDPATLSGGQRRRVALGRALVLRPRLLLLDEPYSGLDAPLRAAVRAEIAELHRRVDAALLLVTHDQGEALALADRLAIIDGGQIAQVGSPLDVHDHPGSSLVARFLGQPPMRLIPGTLQPVASPPLASDLVRFEPGGMVPPDPPWIVARGGLPIGMPILLGLRAEAVRLVDRSVPSTTAGGPVHTTAVVERLEPTGAETLATLRLGPHRLAARFGPRPGLATGDAVVVAVDLNRANWFDAATGFALGGESATRTSTKSSLDPRKF